MRTREGNKSLGTTESPFQLWASYFQISFTSGRKQKNEVLFISYQNNVIRQPSPPRKKYCVNLPHRIKNLEKECVSFSLIQMSTPLLTSYFEMGLPTSERLSMLKSFLKLFPEPRYEEAGHGGALILPCISLSPNPATSCLFSPRFTPTDLKPLPPVKRQVCVSQTAELGC